MGKAELRVEALARRRSLDAGERELAAEAIAAHVMAQPVINSSSRIAVYVSMPSEPGTGPAIDGLMARGIEVIVPVSLADGTLDWVIYSPDAKQVTTSLGIAEPEGERLGGDALLTAGLVIVPALAVDARGHRLGRGAGYYDRALAGTPALRCALLFAGEIVEELPHEPHDVPVNMVITPTGLFRVP
ncbi:MAG: 5-formyltetrahydrofolate cyclo-ligase, partial [Aeromicrobium sp.]